MNQEGYGKYAKWEVGAKVGGVAVQVLLLIWAISAFFWIDWRVKDSEALKNDMERFKAKEEARAVHAEANLKDRIDDYIVQQEKAAAEKSVHDVRSAKHNAQLSEVASSKAINPAIRVIPHIDLQAPRQDVREIPLSLEFTNIGESEAHIHSVEVTVHNAVVTQDTNAVIELAQRWFDIKSRNALGQDTSQDADALQENECPHGQLFSISLESNDVEWQPVDRLRETRSMDVLIRPGESVSNQFRYVMTQSHKPHTSWYRLGITVTLADGASQRFALMLPTHEEVATYVQTMTSRRPSYESGTYRWTSPAPLAPIRGAEIGKKASPPPK